MATLRNKNNLKNSNMDTVNLSIDTLRSLALMQHNGEDFFILNQVAYVGTEEDAREQFEADIEGTEEANIDANFEIFCFNNLEVVAEYDTESYDNDYLVLTDDEADAKWEEELDNYIEECITPEIEKISEGQGNLSYYIKFDEELWKRDARMDGRGHSLSRYDGNENEETVEGETFYIYRQN